MWEKLITYMLQIMYQNCCKYKCKNSHLQQLWDRICNINSSMCLALKSFKYFSFRITSNIIKLITCVWNSSFSNFLNIYFHEHAVSMIFIVILNIIHILKKFHEFHNFLFLFAISVLEHRKWLKLLIKINFYFWLPKNRKGEKTKPVP